MADDTQVERLPSITNLLFASVLGALGGVAFAMLLFGVAYKDEFFVAIDKATPETSVVVTDNQSSPANSEESISSQEYMQAFVWTTRVRLEDLGLGKSLKVSSTPDGKIVVRGALLPSLVGRYNVFKGWFESRETYPPLVDEVSIVKISGIFPKIRSVWLGDNPAIHLENGKNAEVGSEFGDGWKIIEIGRLAVKLERDGTIIELAYKDS